jgi:anaphase-promoting complex subunit 4
MMPALERCSVILSRLGGIAKFQGPNDAMGFSYHQISLVMDAIVCLNLVSTRILTYVIKELDLFHAFSTWLRHEIDRLAFNTSPSSPDEMIEKEAAIDHSKVLLYIESAMTTSRLAAFFQEAATEDYERDWEAAQGQPIFELLDKQLQKHNSGLPYMESILNVELLYRYLSRQAATVFQQIADTEKRNVLFGQPVSIGTASGETVQAMRLCPVVRTPFPKSLQT